MDLFENVIELIKSQEEITNSLNGVNPHLALIFKNCCKRAFTNQVFNNDKLKIESVLDYLHERLNTGHWSNVPITDRQSFTSCSFIKVYLIISFSN